MPRHSEASADVGTSTHFDDFWRIVTVAYVCVSCGFDGKFDDSDTIFEILEDFSSQNPFLRPRAQRAEQNFPSQTQISYLIAINACIL